MAPKKKKRKSKPVPATTTPPTNSARASSSSQPAQSAETESEMFKSKPIVGERGIALVPPQSAYIDSMKWTQFVEAIHFKASRSIVQEFYSTLFTERSNQVKVRGKTVDISPAAINRFYGLPDIAEDGYNAILRDSPTLTEISQILTGGDVGLLNNWCKLDRGQLTVEAKSWHYFICARLMPTKSNSDVRRKRALLTYAILRGASVNVGKVINLEIMAMLDAKKTRSIGFPVLITHLCHQAGVGTASSDPRDTIKTQPEINEKLYTPGEKVKKRQRDADYDEDLDAHANDAEFEDEVGPSYSIMEQRFEELSTRMEEIYYALDARMDTISRRLTALESHFPPPPPPPPHVL